MPWFCRGFEFSDCLSLTRRGGRGRCATRVPRHAHRPILAKHAPNNAVRRQRQTAVVENGRHPIAGDARFDGEQAAQLSIATLLDDIALLVRVDEFPYSGWKRKGAYPHVIHRMAGGAQPIERLEYR